MMPSGLFDLHNAEPAYPDVPGHQATDTSRDAALSMEPGADSLRWAVMQALDLRGPLTADEAADWLKVDKLSIRPRLTELKLLGRVVDSHQRRYNASGHRAIVWALAPREKR